MRPPSAWPARRLARRARRRPGHAPPVWPAVARRSAPGSFVLARARPWPCPLASLWPRSRRPRPLAAPAGLAVAAVSPAAPAGRGLAGRARSAQSRQCTPPRSAQPRPAAPARSPLAAFPCPGSPLASPWPRWPWPRTPRPAGAGERGRRRRATAAGERAGPRPRRLAGGRTARRPAAAGGAIAGEQSSSNSMQVIAKRPAHDVKDITKGEEHVSIPIINEVGNGILPPPFHYIPCNIIFRNAYVDLSLHRIGDENCCSGCFGDCLAEPLPCACATETGGDFAYTRDGLLKKGFLDSRVAGLTKFKCKMCNPCEGHPTKRFIKECWSKCGCAKHCGNRVVQRGITRQLQVFLTPGKKGWGLRAAEELPQGTFICEYVGEILTNNELDERNTQGASKGRHTYATLLDADRDCEDALGDDEALCLDATSYGNVARFINHRCYDANLIDIPVQIETPDRHYYHVAFFTKRKIEPFEELTWDYRIDFFDVNHPITRHSNVPAEASFAGAKERNQDLDRKPWHGIKNL